MYDIAVIGAGVTGAFIAREISRYDLKIVLVEKDTDVANGITKGNTAIIHSGYNAKEGTLKSRLNRIANPMFEEISKELDVPFKRIGSLLIAFHEEGMKKVIERYKRGILNNIKDLRILSKEEILKLEPKISPDIIGGLYAPSTGIICPWELSIALVENAVQNSVTLKLDSKVEDIKKIGTNFEIETVKEKIRTKYIINCAGLFADEINDMVSAPAFKIVPKRGQYYVLDKSAGDLINHAVFQAQKKSIKGVTVTPTVDGNLLIGPSADEIDDKSDLKTTMDQLNLIRGNTRWTSMAIPFDKTIKTFAGLRPKLELYIKNEQTGEIEVDDSFGDFIIEESKDVKGFINVAGIKSPGLTSSPAIAEYVIGILKGIIGELKPNPLFNPCRDRIIRFRDLNDRDKEALIQRDSRYGNVVCRCQNITEGEIVDSIHRKVGATTIDGVKKRVGSGMGRCQGSFCGLRIMKILARELKIDIKEIRMNEKGSYIITDETK